MSLPARLAVGLGLTVVLFGLSFTMLVQPWFTKVVCSRVSEFAAAGLTVQQGLQVAERVRAFSAGSLGDDPSAVLPAVVDGRPGFDQAARSHLADFADVVRGVRLLNVLVAGALTIWALVEVTRRRIVAIAQGMRAGAYASAATVVLATLVGLLSFDRLFAAVHSLFFAPGSWIFASDSLLIRLFPEPFWVAAGLTLAGLVLLGAISLWLVAFWLQHSASAKAVASADRPPLQA